MELPLITELSNKITVDKDVRAGTPVLTGTDFPIARVFQALTAGDQVTLGTVAYFYGVKVEDLVKLFEDLAKVFDKSYYYTT